MVVQDHCAPQSHLLLHLNYLSFEPSKLSLTQDGSGRFQTQTYPSRLFCLTRAKSPTSPNSIIFFLCVNIRSKFESLNCLSQALLHNLSWLLRLVFKCQRLLKAFRIPKTQTGTLKDFTACIEACRLHSDSQLVPHHPPTIQRLLTLSN